MSSETLSCLERHTDRQLPVVKASFSQKGQYFVRHIYVPEAFFKIKYSCVFIKSTLLSSVSEQLSAQVTETCLAAHVKNVSYSIFFINVSGVVIQSVVSDQSHQQPLESCQQHALLNHLLSCSVRQWDQNLRYSGSLLKFGS